MAVKRKKPATKASKKKAGTKKEVAKKAVAKKAVVKKRAEHGDELASRRLRAYKRDLARIRRVRRKAMAGPRVPTKTAGVTRASRGPSTLLPPAFLPRDTQGRRLCTPVRLQAAGDERCTAFAIGAAMEAARCRELQSIGSVPFVSIDDLHPGTPSLFTTAERAEQGVVDERCRPPKQGRCSDAASFEWVLTWNDMGTVNPSDMPDAMRRWLFEKGPIAISVRVFDDFDRFTDPLDTGLVYTPGPNAKALPDAHALCVLGYETTPVETWIVKNSRDVQWGFEGFGRIRVGDPKLEPELIVVAVEQVQVPV